MKELETRVTMKSSHEESAGLPVWAESSGAWILTKFLPCLAIFRSGNGGPT